MTLNLWFNLLTEVFQMMLFNTEILKEDVEFVSEVLQKGNIGYGPLVEEFENKFTSFSRKKYNVATNSASASTQHQSVLYHQHGRHVILVTMLFLLMLMITYCLTSTTIVKLEKIIVGRLF